MMSSKAIEVEFRSPDEPVVCEIDHGQDQAGVSEYFKQCFSPFAKEGVDQDQFV